MHTTHFTPSTVTVMTGTNKAVYEAMLRREYNPLVFASDNLETVAHYYEGYAVEFTVRLEESKRLEYIRCKDDLLELGVALENYTFGSAEMKCPANATWYSFSAEYLKSHLVSIREIFPDLSQWNEE